MNVLYFSNNLKLQLVDVIMPKLPKFSGLTDVSGLMAKMKSALDGLTGPNTSSAAEEALAQESDPVKAKFLEVELLIHQLHDITVIQNKTISELKAKYAEVKTITAKAMRSKEEAATGKSDE